jgi:molecular chaperone HtpG
VYNRRLAVEIQSFVADALKGLIHQFADPMACFREMVQNAVDAGSAEIDVRFEYQQGRLVAHVDDYGEGMDRNIIDNRLTRLFSSGKEGDRTKIGRFGIGFVSVFALDPEVVCIDTSRSGEHWRVIFKPDRSFTRVARATPVDGTKISIYKTMPQAEAEAFAGKARAAIAFWCAHVPADIRVEGKSISRPFALDLPCSVSAEVGDTRISAGYDAGEGSSMSFYNKGLTLLEERPGPFPRVHVRLWSPELEHTMTRDNVMRDVGFERAMGRAREQVEGPLRARLIAVLAARAAVDEVHHPGEASEALLGHLGLHIAAKDELPKEAWKAGVLRCHHAGAVDLTKIRRAGKAGKLWHSAVASPLTEAVHARGDVVLAATPESQAVGLAGVVVGAKPPALKESLCTAVEVVEPDGLVKLRPLMIALLERAGLNARDVVAGDLGYAGSAIHERVGIGQAAPYGVSELGDLGLGRGRTLVLHVRHPAVVEALALADAEREFAAYALVKAYVLAQRGGLPVELDNRLVEHALEVRCRRTT